MTHKLNKKTCNLVNFLQVLYSTNFGTTNSRNFEQQSTVHYFEMFEILEAGEKIGLLKSKMSPIKILSFANSVMRKAGKILHCLIE